MLHSARLLAPLLAFSFADSGAGLAQGLTTAAIAGVVRDDRGAGVVSADVEVLNRATGFVTRARTREDGRYTASGLDVGGPYVVTGRRLGYEHATRDSLYVTIGQALRVDIVLTQQAITLDAISATARDGESTRRDAAVGALISDSVIHRLPIADRDLYGLVRLVPHMSTLYGLSAAGASPRTNAIMIDGSSEQGLYGGNPAAGIWGGKAISLEAVKEYQVLLSPFDVRHGNFAGAMINAVTRSGTNELHGSAFYFGRYGELSRNVPFIRDAFYERDQGGFTLGGPLAKNRVNFFVATEFQRLRFPTVGPYVGQPGDVTPTLQVDVDTLARFASALAQAGMSAGSAGPITAGNPLSNIFGRVDVALPALSSRLVLRENFSRSDSVAFSRPSSPPTANCRSIICFPLSSLARRQLIWKDGTVAQLQTTLPGGNYNELIVGRLYNVGTITPTIRQPLVIVQLGASSLGQTLQAGSYEQAQGDNTAIQSYEVTDNLTLPRGAHDITLGVSAQYFRIRRVDLRGGLGVWTFASIDALALGQASQYRVAQDFGGADVTVAGTQYAVYAGDRWDARPGLTMSYGLRADIPTMGSAPPYNRKVDSLFGRRTDAVPSGRVHWSPRIGFSADLPDARTRVTGGAGVYMGRPPLAWMINAYANYGMPRTLSCGPTPANPAPPPFSADANNPPVTCANGQGLTPDSVGPVNLVDPHLYFPQNLRGSLALERHLGWNMLARVEGQYTRAIHELFFVNLNRALPLSFDAHGRLMYGTLQASGAAQTPLARPTFNADVIELRNQSQDYAYSVATSLEKRFASNLSADVSFTYSRARDVQSHRFTRSPASDNWRLGRVLSGRQDALTLGTSDFDQPYRVIARGTYAFTHHRSTTDVSVYYIGASGFPFTYLAGGDQQRGDLNGDGTPQNDPIYIPRSTSDPAEILVDSTTFTATSQRAALESFIQGAPCLRRQRGRIMERNSCRTPWMNTMHVAVRQSMPGTSSHPVTLELQVFNALNLVNRRWGRIAIPSGLTTAASQANLLTHVRQTAGVSVFRFDPATRRFDATNVDSYYQIQLGARYSY